MDMENVIIGQKNIFWGLPYWKNNLLSHNIDMIHIEKKIDNMFNKTKDNEKERKYLTLYCRQKYLELKPQVNGKMLKCKAKYTLTTDEANLV